MLTGLISLLNSVDAKLIKLASSKNSHIVSIIDVKFFIGVQIAQQNNKNHQINRPTNGSCTLAVITERVQEPCRTNIYPKTQRNGSANIISYHFGYKTSYPKWIHSYLPKRFRLRIRPLGYQVLSLGLGTTCFGPNSH